MLTVYESECGTFDSEHNKDWIDYVRIKNAREIQKWCYVLTEDEQTTELRRIWELVRQETVENGSWTGLYRVLNEGGLEPLMIS